MMSLQKFLHTILAVWLLIAAAAGQQSVSTPTTLVPGPSHQNDPNQLKFPAPVTGQSPCDAPNPGFLIVCWLDGTLSKYGQPYQSLVPTPSTSPTIKIGTVTQLPAGAVPTVTNSGTPTAAVFNFGIPAGTPGTNGPAGPAGPPGPQGANGTDGLTPIVTIGSVLTLPPGSPATVSNTGSGNSVILNFGIPQGGSGTTTSFPSDVACDIQQSSEDGSGRHLKLHCVPTS